MTQIDLIPLLIQTGFAGLFIYLFLDTRRDARRREDQWIKERDERHRELVALTKGTLETLNSLKLVMQQMVDQSRPPFIIDERRQEQRSYPGPEKRKRE